MIGCPVHRSGSDALGSEGPSMFMGSIDATKLYLVFGQQKKQGALCSRKAEKDRLLAPWISFICRRGVMAPI